MVDDVVKKIVKEKQNFERLEMKKSDLLEMFKYNKFKVFAKESWKDWYNNINSMKLTKDFIDK